MPEYGVFINSNFEFNVGEQNKINFLYAPCYRSKDEESFLNNNKEKYKRFKLNAQHSLF